MRVYLRGTPVDILTAEETIGNIEAAIARGSRLQHVALNVAKLVSLSSNAELREDVRSSDIVGIDGMGIVLALKIMGHHHVTRVAGVDLLDDALSLCAKKGYRPFFLGAKAEVVENAAEVARSKYSGLEFAGLHDGYFDEEQEDAICEAIQTSHADCLFIGMPTPRKERLLAKWRHKLDVPFIMGVGGSFDVLAGRVKRAPIWMQKYGLEWAFRIYQEPGRMWWRYAWTNTIFSGLLLDIAVKRLWRLINFNIGKVNS
jgi:N-acetylglucosaminyldiphosphoundecaprenol N-acetyl-beta-D-mannosaminyltransferase